MAEKGHTELLPCPFCGSGMVAQGATGRQTISVWCMKCGARGPDAPFPDFCEPVAQIEFCHQRWNTRAAVNTYPAVEGLVKALEKAEELYQTGLIAAPHGLFDEVQTLRNDALSRFRSLQKGGAN